MVVPGDSVEVHKAFRLGWYVAEVRGRNRPDGPRPDGNDTAPAGGDGDPDPLLLGCQLPADRLRIEAQGVLTSLAHDLGVQENHGHSVDAEAHRLADAREAGDESAVMGQWKALATALWHLDIHVQGTLTAKSEIQAMAYQLGRGLAEIYWALNPKQKTGSQGWGYLLGTVRCSELSRLLGRLSAYLGPYTGSAVSGSIEVWKTFADAADSQSDDTLLVAQGQLRGQIRRWYELIALNQDPTTLIKPFAVLRSVRMVRQALRQFWPQVTLVLVSILVVVGFLVVRGPGAVGGVVKTLGVVIGTVGLSVGGIIGAMKNSAQSLLRRLRQDTYTELIAKGVTVQPPTLTTSDVRDAVASRRLTPSTPG